MQNHCFLYQIDATPNQNEEIHIVCKNNTTK